jgi:uncharacterized protein (TIGR02271 family)
MSNTVIGIFEYTSEAQEAQKYLLNNGFSDGQVDLKVSGTIDNTKTVDHDHDDAGDKISNFFKNLFGDDDDEVNRYSEAGRKGTIVTVHARTADEAEVAARVLDNYGAVDVNETAGSFNTSGTYGVNTTSNSVYSSTDITDTAVTDRSYLSPNDADIADKSYLASNDADIADKNYHISDDADIADRSYVNADIDTTKSTSIPVIEEELHVGKKEVTTGGVRLRSRIIERPVEESIRLREEYVTVERTPVDRLATESDFDTFKEGTVEVVEHAEVPVVSKEARIVEEVSLGKQVEEREEIISDTVRSTQVETEKISGTESNRKLDSDL